MGSLEEGAWAAAHPAVAIIDARTAISGQRFHSLLMLPAIRRRAAPWELRAEKGIVYSESTMAANLFSGVLPFVHVAEAKSFRAASKRLRVTVPAVSKAVARLEADLGVVLLDRTSRHVALTAEGAGFLERCRKAISEVETARAQVASAQRGAQGSLRVTFPPVLARTLLPIFAELVARYPRLSFDLVATNRFARLTRDEFDVAIRMGELESSSLVARTLRRPRWLTVAAPGYLEARGLPRHPADLERHECLGFALEGRTVEWSFVEGGAPLRTHGTGRLRFDQGEMLVDAALRGLGIAQMFDFMAHPLLATGQLVEVLRAHAAPGPELRAVVSAKRASIPRVRILLDALTESLRPA